MCRPFESQLCRACLVSWAFTGKHVCSFANPLITKVHKLNCLWNKHLTEFHSNPVAGLSLQFSQRTGSDASLGLVRFVLWHLCQCWKTERKTSSQKQVSWPVERCVIFHFFFFFSSMHSVVNISRKWAWVCVSRHSNKVQNLNLLIQLMQPQGTVWHVHCCWRHCCCVLQDGVIVSSGSNLIQMAWPRWSKGKTLHLDDNFEIFCGSSV